MSLEPLPPTLNPVDLVQPTFEPRPPPDGSTINDVLPAELLSSIFECGFEMEKQGDDSTHSEIGLESSVVMSHVCSLWRTVALGTPTLWNYVHIDDGTPLDKTAAWLARSKAIPLTISFMLSTQHVPVISLLVEHMNRWHEVMIETSPPASMGDVLAHLNGKSTPILHRLYIDDGLSDEFSDEIVGDGINIFDGPGSTPKLTELSLWSASINWSTHPFSALTSLEIAYIPHNTKPSLDQFTTLLRSCPSLAKLAICNGAIHPAHLTPTHEMHDPLQNHTFSMPTLHSLTLTDFDSPNILNSHLRLLHAPNLKHLGIIQMHSDGEGEPIDFTTSFELLARGEGPSRALANIQSLKMVAINCDSADALESFFCGLLNLRRLHFRVGGFNDPEEETDPRLLAAHYLRAFIPSDVRRTQNIPTLSINEACPLVEEICLGGFGEQMLWVFVWTKRATVKRVLIYRDPVGADEATVKKIQSLGIQVDEYSDSEYEDDRSEDDTDSDEGSDEGEGE